MTRRDRRRGGGVPTLIALNAALLAALGWVSWSGPAEAQSPPRSDYVMVAGRVAGSAIPALWVVDQTREELVALMWNPTTARLEGVGYRSLASDASALLRGQP